MREAFRVNRFKGSDTILVMRVSRLIFGSAQMPTRLAYLFGEIQLEPGSLVGQNSIASPQLHNRRPAITFYLDGGQVSTPHLISPLQ